MIRVAIFLSVLALAVPVRADIPLSGAEFDALTQGKTLGYFQGEFAYGMEEYLPNRRVRWTFLDGECHEGEWYEAGDLICFVYEGPADGPHCWRFITGPGGMEAHYAGDPEGTPPITTIPTSQPLECTGPKVGV